MGNPGYIYMCQDYHQIFNVHRARLGGGWGEGVYIPPTPMLLRATKGEGGGWQMPPLPPPYMHTGVPDFFPVGGNYPQLFIPVHVLFPFQFMCRVQFSRFLFMCLSFSCVPSSRYLVCNHGGVWWECGPWASSSTYRMCSVRSVLLGVVFLTYLILGSLHHSLWFFFVFSCCLACGMKCCEFCFTCDLCLS